MCRPAIVGRWLPTLRLCRRPLPLADEQWARSFRTLHLQRLIQEALANNLDLRIAAQRVLEAQAQVGIARSLTTSLDQRQRRL